MARATGFSELKQCSACEQLFPVLHRRYFEKAYCASCYSYLFPRLICVACHQEKRIYRHESKQVCQQCLLLNVPCHRCRKPTYTLGKITHFGPVCNSCARYYNDVKNCFRCGKNTRWLSRYLMFGEQEPICFKCLKKAHFKRCTNCREIKPPYFSNLDRSTLCRSCTDKPFKLCIVCQAEIPAGAFGHKCRQCFAEATFLKRLNLNKVGFVVQISKLYEEYANWLALRCGHAKASRQILLDRNVFVFLDDWYRRNYSFPPYERYRKELTVGQNRQNILAQKFMFEKKIISVAPDEISIATDKNTIRRIINIFKADRDSLSSCILGYYNHLLSKYRKGLTSIRSIRLALTPASQMLYLAKKLTKVTVDQELVNQYLWLHLGQRAALTGFISYLRNQLRIDVVIKPEEYFTLARTRETKRRIRLQLLDYCRNDGQLSSKYIQLALAFYHGIHFPHELRCIELFTDCKHDPEMLAIRIAKRLYLIPILPQ